MLDDLLLVLPGIVLAFVVEGATGFGATVVAVALATRYWPLQELLSALVPVNAALSASIVWKHRADVDARTLGREVVPAMLLGFPIGVLALRHWGKEHGGLLLQGFALFVIAVALWDIVRPLVRKSVEGQVAVAPLPARLAFLAAGVVHGAWNTAGPIVVAVMSRKGWDKGRFRATLSALWLSFSVVAYAGFLQDGAVDRRAVLRSLALLPATVIGRVVGQWVHDRVSQDGFRRVVAVLLFFVGLSIWTRS